MPPKRPRPPEDDAADHANGRSTRNSDLTVFPQKHQRLNANPFSRRNTRDRLSALPNELTVRILSFLPISTLLDVALVSHHFGRLSCDSQLWRALYYSRFVLPRALRIPGFRDGTRRHGARLHYSARRAVWADGGGGRRGGLVDLCDSSSAGDNTNYSGRSGRTSAVPAPAVDWKRQYKLRHNWAEGKASVEELEVGGSSAEKTLVKVVEGIAVTADVASGLRAWDLKTKALLAQIDFKNDEGLEPLPTCLSVDEQLLADGKLDVCVGFSDGSFGVWRLDIQEEKILLRHRHAKSSNGQLIGLAYRHPFLLTATESVLVSLYDYELALVNARKRKGGVSSGKKAGSGASSRLDLGYESSGTDEPDGESESETEPEAEAGPHFNPKDNPASLPAPLPAPILMTSLKSHSSKAPLALSIRKSAGSVVASIAYTFLARQGWSIGIQDLYIRRDPGAVSKITSTRLAYTTPISTAPCNGATRSGDSSSHDDLHQITADSFLPPEQQQQDRSQEGPTTLCYSHPYLLATLPDNTLVLHVCTSSATSLSLSPGIRLWGHTSGISDAEITARGKAMSVSCRGDEIRVWELEGRTDGKSIKVKSSPSQGDEIGDGSNGSNGSTGSNGFGGDDDDRSSVETAAVAAGHKKPKTAKDEWDDRRNWVGFDDEMAIVLKEAKDGRESLVVYDFT